MMTLQDFNPKRYDIYGDDFWSISLAEAAYYIGCENADICDTRINRETGEVDFLLYGAFALNLLHPLSRDRQRKRIADHSLAIINSYEKLKELSVVELKEKSAVKIIENVNAEMIKGVVNV